VCRGVEPPDPPDKYSSGGDAVRLGSKDRYEMFAGKTVCCHI